MAMQDPSLIQIVNHDLELLITDSNRSIATLAITTLLKVWHVLRNDLSQAHHSVPGMYGTQNYHGTMAGAVTEGLFCDFIGMNSTKAGCKGLSGKCDNVVMSDLRVTRFMQE